MVLDRLNQHRDELYAYRRADTESVDFLSVQHQAVGTSVGIFIPLPRMTGIFKVNT